MFLPINDKLVFTHLASCNTEEYFTRFSYSTVVSLP